MAAFTTIAAAVGVAATLGGTAMSFANASKQGKLVAEAKAAADASMQKARQALEINYQKELAVKKEPYELEREAALAAGAQAIEAGVEAGQAAPTAGRVVMAQNLEQANIQQRMGQEMTAIDKSIINENSRLRDVGVQMDLGEAEGAQLAARDAQKAQARATEQAMQGIVSAGQQVASFAPLYGRTTKTVGDTSVRNARGFMDYTDSSYQSPIGDRFANTALPVQNNYQVTPQANVNPFQPSLPKPGTRYGMFGVDFNGVGGY